MANTTLLQYKCPCCGGPLPFNTEAQTMKCPYCDSEVDVAALSTLDEALDNQLPDSAVSANDMGWTEEEMAGMKVYVCASCGGSIVGDANTAATSCPYCGNPVIVQENFSGLLKPDYVIPFKLNKEDAKAKFREHLEGKRLLPKVFKTEAKIDSITGLYVPYWLFDSEVSARCSFDATKVNSWSDSKYEYTETKHYSVVRGGAFAFDKVPADGSSKMPDDLMESLEPYDFSQAVDFQTAYLSGFMADKYDVTAEDSVERINERIRNSAYSLLRDEVNGYTTVSRTDGAIHVDDRSVKYAFYPVWVMNTIWKDQSYLFAMNGQTGKFVGNLPMDKRIKRRWFWGLTLGIGAALFGLFWLIVKLGLWE